MDEYTIFEEVISIIQQSILDSECLVCDKSYCLERKSLNPNWLDMLLLFIKRKAMEAKDMHYTFFEFFDVCKSEFDDMVRRKFTSTQAFDDMKKRNLKKDEFLSIIKQIEGVILQAERELINEPSKVDDDKHQRFIDIIRLKEYLIPSVFTKKGKRKSKADYLVMLMKAEDRTDSDFAVIAEFLKANHLLKDKYKFSLDWAPWLKIFYSIAGVNDGYNYRPGEANNDNLTNMLCGLFQIE